MAIDVCGNPLSLADTRRLEWLETDGLGGYALSTVSLLPRRRYHGLLVAATSPPAGRSLLLAGLDETLVVGGERFDLGVNRYPGTFHPEGDRLLASFSREPFPAWVYRAGSVRLERTFFLVHGETTAVLGWRLLPSAEREAVTLLVRPRLAFRDHHALRSEGDGLDVALDVGPGRVVVRPRESPGPLAFCHEGAALERASWWVRDVELDVERDRGYDCREDLLSPFGLSWELAPGEEATLVVSASGRSAAEAGTLRRAEEARRRAIAGPSGDPPLLRALRRAADDFVVARGAGKSVVAGYPWFADWGRDTMVSLPGLLLATGRHAEAREVLRTYARLLDRGLVPSRFADGDGPPAYDAADATLWFVEAVRSTWRATGDGTLLSELYPALLRVLEAHERGTRHGIRTDEDGLLWAGAEGVALTWMDARVSGRPVTPRAGRPVEVQALWFHALASLAEMASALGEGARASLLLAKADRAKRSFERLFWNEGAGCLFDGIGEDGVPDPAIRPNQLFAVSLPHAVLGGERAASVLDAVERDLLTPPGLRTLAPPDPAYRSRYEGGPHERDRAYHQGTVWPWLIGPYASACLAVRGRGSATVTDLASRLRPLAEHLLGEGLGQLPELFDGDEPRRPGGCPAQAWSVAELLRILAEVPQLVARLS